MGNIKFICSIYCNMFRSKGSKHVAKDTTKKVVLAVFNTSNYMKTQRDV
jgi:hypothetical protein